MNKKTFIIVLAVVVVGLGAWYFLPRGDDQQSQNVNPPPTPQPQSELPAQKTTNSEVQAPEIPPLYPSLNWQPVEPTLGKQAIIVTDAQFHSVSIDIPGQEWMAKVLNENGSQTKIQSEIFEWYDSKLPRNQWTQALVSADELDLQALAADGATGSRWGYLNVTGGNVRVIALDTFYENPEYTKPRPDCPPCSSIFRVFVSDDVPLSEIISALR